VKSATVRVRSREITVEQSPLPERRGVGHHQYAPSQPRAGLLVIRPAWPTRLVAWVLIALGAPGLLIGLLGMLDHMLAVLPFVWGVGLALPGACLLGPRYRFDTAAGRLTVRGLWSGRSLPLAAILAVQVIDGGRHSSQRGTYSTYQMNLVFDDPHPSRLLVTNYPDCAVTRATARRLAKFLGVSLLDAANR
jgi:hypothetical protein